VPEEPHPTRIAIAQQFLLLIGRREFDRGVELLSPNATYRVPGNNALAGTFSGPQEIMGHLVSLFERTGGTYDAFKWEDWMLGENHVAVLANVHINTKGQMYKARHLYLTRFDAHDKIDDITVFFEDQRAADRFLGP
jgi:ketosteroid isomerase-like protein